MMLRRIDPLFQFLGIGALLFAAAGLVRPFADDDRTINVTRADLESYLAAGGGESLAPLARAGDGAPTLDRLNGEQKRALVRSYVEEQALYREARDWGLEDGDLVIRRRLGQSIRFALRPEIAADPGDPVLRRFHAAHADNYRRPVETSFEHVFFSSEQRGAARALADARAAQRAGIADWRATGDRFAYQRSYGDAGASVIEAQLGAGFRRALDRLPVVPARWEGPVASDSGYHLVRITARSPARTATFEDARHAVLDDWQRATQKSELDRAVAGVVGRYRTKVDPDLVEGGESR